MTVPGVGGKPLKFQSLPELQQKINDYFESCWEEAWEKVYDKDEKIYIWRQQFDKDNNPVMRMKERPTVTGLAIALGTSRNVLIEYEKRNDEFSDAIKKAKTLVEYYYEKGAVNGEIHPAVGIFALKNFGWTDVLQINSNSVPEQLSPDDIRRQLMERKKMELSAGEQENRDDEGWGE